MKARPSEIHFYEWYISRWRTSVAHEELDCLGRGAYREMLDTCYAQGSCSSDLRILANLCSCSIEDLEARWPLLRKHFRVSKQDSSRLENDFASLFRRQHFEYVKEQRKKGKKGGIGRLNKFNGIESNGLATASEKTKQQPSHCLENSEAKNKTKNKNKNKKEEQAAAAAQQFPAAAAAIRERFPATDERVIQRVLQSAAAINPAIEDHEILACLPAATRANQQSAALYLDTLPEVVRSWRA